MGFLTAVVAAMIIGIVGVIKQDIEKDRREFFIECMHEIKDLEACERITKYTGGK